MTIIDVARELEKDGTKAFERFYGNGNSIVIGADDQDFMSDLTVLDLLATDWEEVKE